MNRFWVFRAVRSTTRPETDRCVVWNDAASPEWAEQIGYENELEAVGEGLKR